MESIPLTRDLWYQSGIYCILHIESGQYYIGSAVNLRKRWNAHRRDLRKCVHHCEHLQRAWNKYGELSFEFRVIETVSDRSVLVEREQHWFDLAHPSFNTCKVAGTCEGLKRPMPEEQKKKLSQALKGRIRSKEHCESISLANKGRKHTEQAKANMRAAQQGKIISDEQKLKLSAARKGKPVSEAQLAAIRNMDRSGWKFTEEMRAKWSAASKARVFSDDHKRKISESISKWHAERKRRTAEI